MTSRTVHSLDAPQDAPHPPQRRPGRFRRALLLLTTAVLSLTVPWSAAAQEPCAVLERVNVSSTGGQSNGNLLPLVVTLSADGRFVTFLSTGSNLVPDDTNQQVDAFVHDRVLGTTTRVNVRSDGSQMGFAPGSLWVTVSPDGRYAAFSVGDGTHGWHPYESGVWADQLER